MIYYSANFKNRCPFSNQAIEPQKILGELEPNDLCLVTSSTSPLSRALAAVVQEPTLVLNFPGIAGAEAHDFTSEKSEVSLAKRSQTIATNKDCTNDATKILEFHLTKIDKTWWIQQPGGRSPTKHTGIQFLPGVSSHQIRCKIGYRPSKVRNLKPVGCWSKSCGNTWFHMVVLSQLPFLNGAFLRSRGTLFISVYHPVVNQLIPPSQLRRGWPPVDPHTVESQRPSYSSSARFPLARGLGTHVFFQQKLRLNQESLGVNNKQMLKQTELKNSGEWRSYHYP